ncbi:C4-dicarboxylate ABC transporter, partial [Aliarcobacter butzleri]|nr:C4-dicarboxylate ABC transporter [Aliarcobacter butzleri]
KLPKDLQEKVAIAMKEATELERKETAIEDAKIMEALKKYSADTKKLEIYQLTDEQVAKWRKVMEAIYPQFYDVIGEDLIKKAIETK